MIDKMLGERLVGESLRLQAGPRVAAPNLRILPESCGLEIHVFYSKWLHPVEIEMRLDVGEVGEPGQEGRLLSPFAKIYVASRLRFQPLRHRHLTVVILATRILITRIGSHIMCSRIGRIIAIRGGRGSE